MKKIAVIVGVLSVLLAAAALTLSIWSRGPAEKLKEMALERGSDAIGRTLTAGEFGGNPFTGFTVRDIHAAEAPGAEQSGIVLKAIRFRLSWRDLFRRKITFRAIDIIGPSAVVVRYADGSTNMDDLIPDKEEDSEEKSQTGGDEQKEASTLKKKAAAALRFEKINLKDGSLKLILHQPEGDPIELTLAPIDVALTPLNPGNLKRTRIDARVALDSLITTAAGDLDLNGDNALDLAWKTSRISFAKPPKIFAPLTEALKQQNASGNIEAEGELTGGFDSMKIDAKATLANIEAMKINLGGGAFDVAYAHSKAAFSGGMKSDDVTLDAGGDYLAGEKPHLNANVKLSGVSAQKAAKLFVPELENVVVGTAGASINITGPGLNPARLVASGEANVDGGQINYPTPSLRGEPNAWANLPFKTASIKFRHERPTLSVSEFSIVALDGAASGSGSIKYEVDLETGKPTGAAEFDIVGKIDCPDIAAALARNPHLGPMLAGKLIAEAHIAGKTGDLSSLNGSASFALSSGRIVNPYIKESGRLPLNETLSNFAFAKFSGNFSLADRAIKTNSLALRSGPLNADIKGSLGFDGSLSANAGASVSTDAVASMNEFKNMLPQIQKLKNLKRIDAAFAIGGDIHNPRIEWQFKQILKEETKKFIDKGKEKVKNLLGGEEKADNLTDKIKDKFKKLF